MKQTRNVDDTRVIRYSIPIKTDKADFQIMQVFPTNTDSIYLSQSVHMYPSEFVHIYLSISDC